MKMKMSFSSLQDFQRCRLCALPISSSSLVPFFDTIYEPMIARLTSFGLQINKDDGLPDNICQGCTGILTTFIETMELFLAADIKLKKLLEVSKQNKSEKQISERKNATERKEDQGKKRSKRKTEGDFEMIETKRAKRRDRLNLLRKSRTPVLNVSENTDDKEAEVKSESIINKSEEIKQKSESIDQKKYEETNVRKKHEGKENLQTKVQNDSVNGANEAQESAVRVKTEVAKDCVKRELSNFDVMNVVERHSPDYGRVSKEKQTEEARAENNSINNVTGYSKIKEELNISGESDFGPQISKTPSKHIKILTLEKLDLPTRTQETLPTTSNAWPSVYTQPSDDKEIDVFTCLECSQISWNRKTTLEHIYKEHARGAITYKARYMVKRVKNAKAYNSQKQIVCMLCFFTFDDSFSYLEHLTGHYMVIYKCVHCYQNFSSKEAVQKHKQAHRNDIIICKICDKAMPLELYTAHEKSHSLFARFQKVSETNKLETEKRLKSCGQINDDEERERKKILNNQITISAMEAAVKTEVEKITCEEGVKEDGNGTVDNEKFSNNGKQALKALDENKSGGEIQEIPAKKLVTEVQKEKSNIYKCTNCFGTFKERGAILKHIQKIHPLRWANKKNLLTIKKLQTNDEEADANDIYLCRICTFDFDSESKYFAHLKSHHNCKYCSKTFYHKEEMKVHMRSHEKPFRCDICDASFYVEKNYLDHKLTHSYQCDLCKASYRTMESLVNHKKIAHPKISCPICSASFNSPLLLNKHEATHAKKKTPSLCELCGKSYSNVTRFNYHMLSHSKDSEFSCQFCPMSFKSTAKLKRHQRFSHLDAYTESLGESLELEEN